MTDKSQEVTIPNHVTAKLSDLDMQVAVAVPPGGNWKDVPESVPSKRLHTIRESYKRGEGSRSTYYGRLLPDKPSYTINTYFSRPGNGCHLHYDYEGGQHRVLSQREAARLQSFPDDFVFEGSKTSINKQIGNAVPPVLAYQIAESLDEPGSFVDLFAGAGGLGLGFRWAGWKPIIANDIVEGFLRTYASNVHSNTIVGDIRDTDIVEEIVERVRSVKRTAPLWVLGGPPCQGFSTAGKRRTMQDKRNHLFWNYRDLLDALEPDGFLFENVTGLLNMDSGHTFQRIREVLGEAFSRVTHWVLKSEEFAVPQRRSRVFILGSNNGETLEAPSRLTGLDVNRSLFGEIQRAVSVEEALGDLPPLKQGQDGSNLSYEIPPSHPYQEFMRGKIGVADYLASIVSRG